MAAPSVLADVVTDVLVVGAGPSGLMAAVCLARLGVDVTIVDGKSEPTRESRALALQARSMEIFDQLGLVEAVLAECDSAPQVVPGYRTRVYRPVGIAGFGRTLTPYPGIHMLEQSRTERILTDAYRDLGGDVLWRHELRNLRIVEQAGYPVEAQLVAAGAAVTIRARWCIGADGASSTVRDLLGIAFEGATNPLRFYVADARGVEGLEEGVRTRLDAEFHIRDADSAWFSSYRVHHRLAARVRQGPVFLVGDAAHVHSPVGAQGMNTGLQDAHNLACKLADVVAGRRGADTLDGYEAERRPVAQRLVATTDAIFARITSGGRAARFVRNRLFPLLAPLAVRVVPRLIGTERSYGYVAQLRIHYTMGPDRRRGRRDRIVGRRLAWSGDNFGALRSMTWQVHGYGAPAEAVDATAGAVGLDAHAFGPDRHGRLDPRLLYLVRPDGFVAAAATPAGAPDRFETHLRSA